MDELAREYDDTHDPEILAEIYELARRLRGDGTLTGRTGSVWPPFAVSGLAALSNYFRNFV
jgi:hypothetical protein